MKQTPLACLRGGPHPFGLWWPPMAPHTWSRRRSICMCGALVASCPWGDSGNHCWALASSSPWTTSSHQSLWILAETSAMPPYVVHSTLCWQYIMPHFEDVCIESFPLLDHFSLHPKGDATTRYLFILSFLLSPPQSFQHWSDKSRWIPMTS